MPPQFNPEPAFSLRRSSELPLSSAQDSGHPLCVKSFCSPLSCSKTEAGAPSPPQLSSPLNLAVTSASFFQENRTKHRVDRPPGTFHVPSRRQKLSVPEEGISNPFLKRWMCSPAASSFLLDGSGLRPRVTQGAPEGQSLLGGVLGSLSLNRHNKWGAGGARNKQLKFWKDPLCERAVKR